MQSFFMMNKEGFSRVFFTSWHVLGRPQVERVDRASKIEMVLLFLGEVFVQLEPYETSVVVVHRLVVVVHRCSQITLRPQIVDVDEGDRAEGLL
jgi:hypothetical protein